MVENILLLAGIVLTEEAAELPPLSLFDFSLIRFPELCVVLVTVLAVAGVGKLLRKWSKPCVSVRVYAISYPVGFLRPLDKRR